MARGIVCQKCGVEAPTTYVEFYYNIGMLVMRRQMSIKANLCKRCIHKTFWRYTLMDMTVGWWGVVSLVMTPIFLINNIVRYIGAIPLPATPKNAAPPQLTSEAAGKIEKFSKEIVQRLNNKEPLTEVATSIGRQAEVTPGQIVLYVRALSRQQPAIPSPAPISPVATPIPLEPEPDASPAPSPAPPAQPDLLGDIGAQ